jgi:hypothetical protein
LSTLEELAGKNFRDGLNADERAGLALWYVLGGDYAEVSQLTQKGEGEFLNREVKDLTEQLRKEELGPQMAATRMLEAAHQAIKGGHWQQALQSVDQIHQQHPAFSASHSFEQERIKLEAQDGLERANKLAALKAQAPSGATVAMRGWRVSVDYPLDKVGFPLAAGWQRAENGGGGVTFVPPMPTLSTATQSALIMKSLLEMEGVDSDGITVRISMSFPEEGEVPRLMLLRCHGIGVVFGLLRDGEIMAEGVRASELTDLKKMRQQLLPGLRDAANRQRRPAMYPGVRHRLKLRITRRGRKLREALYLDDNPQPLVDYSVQRPRSAAAALALIAMHPLTVHSVRFEGELERK